MATAVFATADMGRIFIACQECRKVMPHYRIYGRRVTKATDGRCQCGSTTFKPIRLPEWKAALWVVGVGWLWRKTIRKEREWDPRMPIRAAELLVETPR